MVPEDQLEVETVTEKVTSETGGRVSLSDNTISLDIKPDAISGDASISMINGFTLDDIEDDLSRETIEHLLSTIAFPIDVYQVHIQGGAVESSFKVTIDFSKFQNVIEDYNSYFLQIVPDMEPLSYEDIDVFYVDTWLRMLSPVDMVYEGSTGLFKSHYDGIFFLAISDEKVAEIGQLVKEHPDIKALMQESGEPVSGAGSSAMDTRSVDIDYQTWFVTQKEKKYKGHWTPCTAGNALNRFHGFVFDGPCLTHDYCYKYGRYTYGFNNYDCNTRFMGDLWRACQKKYLPIHRFKCSSRKGLFGGFMKRVTCRLGEKVTNALTWASPIQHMLYLACAVDAGAMRIGVGVGTLIGYGVEPMTKSGCYDYMKKGRKCEIARFQKITVNGKSSYSSLFPLTVQAGTSVDLKAYVMNNHNSNDLNKIQLNEEEYRHLRPDRVIWELTGNNNTTAYFGTLEKTITDDTLDGDGAASNTWHIPDSPDINGRYTLNVTMYKDGRVIDTEAVYILVTNRYRSITYDPERGTQTISVKTGRHCSGMLWWKKCSDTYAHYSVQDRTITEKVINKGDTNYVLERITVEETGVTAAANKDYQQITAYNENGDIIWRTSQRLILAVHKGDEGQAGIIAIEKVASTFEVVQYSDGGVRQILNTTNDVNGAKLIDFMVHDDGSAVIIYLAEGKLTGLLLDTEKTVVEEKVIDDSNVSFAVSTLYDNQYAFLTVSSGGELSLVAIDSTLTRLWKRSDLFDTGYAEWSQQNSDVVSMLAASSIDPAAFYTALDIGADIDGSVYISVATRDYTPNDKGVTVQKYNRMGSLVWQGVYDNRYDSSFFIDSIWREYNRGHIAIYGDVIYIVNGSVNSEVGKMETHFTQISAVDGAVRNTYTYIPDTVTGLYITDVIMSDVTPYLYGAVSDGSVGNGEYVRNSWTANSLEINL